MGGCVENCQGQNEGKKCGYPFHFICFIVLQIERVDAGLFPKKMVKLKNARVKLPLGR